MQTQWLRVGSQIINLNQVMKFEIGHNTVHIHYSGSTADNGDQHAEPFYGEEARDLIGWLNHKLNSDDAASWSTKLEAE